MSRFEGDFFAAGDASLSTTELLNLLGTNSALTDRERQEAIACFLSASEGWDQALKTLRGAFATDAAQAIRAREIKPNKRDVNQRTSEYLQRVGLKSSVIVND